MPETAVPGQPGISSRVACERERVKECRTRLDAHRLVKLEVRWWFEGYRW